MAIFLIRHGETPGNATRTVQHPDIGLSLLERVDLEGVDTIEQRTLRRLLTEALPRKSAALKSAD